MFTVILTHAHASKPQNQNHIPEVLLSFGCVFVSALKKCCANLRIKFQDPKEAVELENVVD
jgi:hypothetical protein